MSKVYLETRQVFPGKMQQDIAHHLYMRNLEGVAVVITDSRGTLGSVAKRWRRLTTSVQSERSRTLATQRILLLSRQGERMKRVNFISGPPSSLETSGIFFTDAMKLRDVPPNCHTMYITCGISNEEMKRLVAVMPDGSLVVTYEWLPPPAGEKLRPPHDFFGPKSH